MNRQNALLNIFWFCFCWLGAMALIGSLAFAYFINDIYVALFVVFGAVFIVVGIVFAELGDYQ